MDVAWLAMDRWRDDTFIDVGQSTDGREGRTCMGVVQEVEEGHLIASTILC